MVGFLGSHTFVRICAVAMVRTGCDRGAGHEDLPGPNGLEQQIVSLLNTRGGVEQRIRSAEKIRRIFTGMARVREIRRRKGPVYQVSACAGAERFPRM